MYSVLHSENYWVLSLAEGESGLIPQKSKLYGICLHQKQKKKDPKLFGKNQLCSTLHSLAHRNMRTFVQAIEERRKDQVDQGLSKGL